MFIYPLFSLQNTPSARDKKLKTPGGFIDRQHKGIGVGALLLRSRARQCFWKERRTNREMKQRLCTGYKDGSMKSGFVLFCFFNELVWTVSVRWCTVSGFSWKLLQNWFKGFTQRMLVSCLLNNVRETNASSVLYVLLKGCVFCDTCKHSIQMCRLWLSV